MSFIETICSFAGGIVTKLDRGYTGPGLLDIKTVTCLFAAVYSDD